jgi:hypothetical protein
MNEVLYQARTFVRLSGRFAVTLSIVVLLVVVCTPTARAYVGPGAGLGMLGTLIAVLIVLLASVFGLILYIYRTITRRKKDREGQAGSR